MMWWKKRKKKQRALPSFLIRWLSRGNEQLIRLADYLQGKTNTFSRKKKLSVLLVFSIVFGGGSILIAFQGFHNTLPLKTTSIQTIPLSKEGILMVPRFTSREVQRIHQLKQYLDSLQGTSNGLQIRDSLLKGRTHLLDSIKFLENVFNEQTKTNRHEQ